MEYKSALNLLETEIAIKFIKDTFEKELANRTSHWVGSTNQRVINIQESMEKGKVILHESN